jgi:polyphosphate:AMP phosphotransferase
MPRSSAKPATEERHELTPAMESQLRAGLLKGQFDLNKLARFPVVVLLSGDDRSGINAALNFLHEWLDARYLELFSFGPETPEEKGRPPLWRYWNNLPRRGRIGVYYHAYGINSVVERLSGALTDKAWRERLDDIRSFEKQLSDDGALILKFWMPSPLATRKKSEPRKVVRLNEVWTLPEEKNGKSKVQRDRYDKVTQQLLTETSTTASSWTVVDQGGTDERCLAIATALRVALTSHLKTWRDPRRGTPPRVVCFPGEATLPDQLGALPAKPSVASDPEAALDRLQTRLQHVSERAYERKLNSIIVFEGPDAAGKGGVIRRMTCAMDALHYRVHPIAKPTPEENQFHYLWRFWNKLPRPGHMAIFDRSWYGRVLVERVEGFATKTEWTRAYDEINDFERQITRSGTVLLKFFLHIDFDEQLGRFERRLGNPLKKHKITEEDFRNRDKWKPHCQAANVMFARTSPPHAPWTVIPANSKKAARILVLEKVVNALEERL